MPAEPRPGRTGGIVLAALALPIGLLVALSGAVTGEFFIVTALAGLLLTLGLAVFGYRRAGLAPSPSIAVPLLVLALAAAVFVGEITLWLLAFEGIYLAIAIAGIVAIPLLTIAGLLGVGAARRKRRRTGL
ncbi:hypothetical protein [Ruania halotolerans]|uniref:hypothetical protein n=1 Tax=Ruania halotolerans TaxID=2897773 RepID=UPI001E2FF45F|nr:hypothetical protein [Ruania halotolerans]UFU07071.1 hypothetical protein LQF10_02860 [Ruania halotolerans]